MVTPSSEAGAGSSNEPESMMTGTPSLRRCAIKPEESPPRRWKSTSATCGRRSVISFVASAVVAAGPVTIAPKSSRCCFRASATLWESSTRRISNPRRSSSDPLASGGLIVGRRHRVLLNRPSLVSEHYRSLAANRPFPAGGVPAI
jgi:hypothetical protein